MINFDYTDYVETNNTVKYIKKLVKQMCERGIPKKYYEDVIRIITEALDSDDDIQIKRIAQLSLMAQLDWDSPTPSVNFKKTKSTLDIDHACLEEAKDKILDYVAVLKHKVEKGAKPSPLLFIGPPGVGKSTFAKSIAKALNRPMQRVFLGGVTDPHGIYGFRPTYVGAAHGDIIEAIRRAKSRHCVILLDEIDKIPCTEEASGVANALMSALDKSQNYEFKDFFLELPFDLSDTLFIATANYSENIHPAIIDRCEVIELSSYTEDEKFTIARKHLVPNLKKEYTLNSSQYSITDRAVTYLIKNYTREAGVRKLEYLLKSLAKKMLRFKAERKNSQIKQIKTPDLRSLLGPEFYLPEDNTKPLPIGCSCGLGVSEYGGALILIEAVRFMRDPDDIKETKIKLTGMLGPVMQESANIVLSLLRKEKQAFSVDINKWDIHVNVPGDGVEGPSAGTSMFVALFSLFSDKQVRSDVAMTGEVNLRGEVKLIGGLKEKIIAAFKENKTKVVIPKENVPELDHIPKKIRNALEIVAVDNIQDLLKEVGLK